jgi:hypothetical protein
MPEYVSADETGEVTLPEEIPRHDTDRVIGAECRVWEANAPCVLTALYATAYDAYFAVGASLEELAMSRVGLAYQYGRCPGINYRPNLYGFAEFEP